MGSENDRFCKACNKAMDIMNYAEHTMKLKYTATATAANWSG
jgi:hypothetical protein